MDFELIYQQFHRRIYYFVLEIVKQHDIAQDITSSAFIKLWKHITNAKNKTEARNFLYISAKNEAFDFLKYQKTHNHVSVDNLEDIADNIVIESELVELVRKEIESLPPACREVFKLSYIEGKKSGEIAKILGISWTTVKAQRRIGLNKIRERVKLLSYGANDI